MISGMLSPSSLCQQDFSHLKMESACFECSFGRSLAPDADSDCSSLPGDLILPISHDEKHILLQAVLLSGGSVSGMGGMLLKPSFSKDVEVGIRSPVEEDRNHCQGAPAPARSNPGHLQGAAE